MALNDTGSWGELKDWPLIGLHAIVTQDGKVLTFGTDQNGMQSGAFIYDLWDPVTDTHTTLDNKTATDIFCSAAIILPGTNQIIIGGGDGRPQGAVNTGVDDVNFFNSDSHELTQSTLGEMNFARWYPTMISLPSGQAVILGGRGGKNEPGVGTPEIFTPGEGWRKLDGANDPDLVPSNSYPRAFVNGDGNVVYFASGRGNTGQTEVRVLDPSGNGSLETIATLPFDHAWATPAIMYEAGKVLISASNGDMWTMDITGPTPVFEQTGSLEHVRQWSDLTVMADGKVLVNGGSSQGNTNDGADKTAAIWDPETGEWDYTVDEVHTRLYHSSSVLLADGTIISLGGGAPGPALQLNGQVYKPPYLYDADGNLAERPEISGAPAELNPGDTFTITSDSTISKMTLVKNGATTHSFNMEARMVNLEFTQAADGTIQVELPENANEITAGSWMLFAFDEAGVPAMAPIIAIQPTIPLFDGIGDVTAEYFAIDADAASFDQINFEGNPIHSQRVTEINESGTSPFYPGGPSDDFAVRYEGDFYVSQPGEYTFYLTSDDGSRLMIDGQQVIDANQLQAPKLETVTVTLDAGTHNFELFYFEAGGSGTVDLDWSGPGFTRTQMRFDGAEENLLTNGSLEKANLAGNTAHQVTDLPGWTIEKSAELWANGFGKAATSGYTIAEIDGATGGLSQTVATEDGQTYSLSFDLAGRDGHLESKGTEIVWNGEVVATIDPIDGNFHRYELEVTGTGGNDTLTFRSVEKAANDFHGELLDSVVLKVASDPVTPPPGGNLVQDVANETQYLDGSGDNDIFVINGNSTDYGWGATQDGTGTVVWGPTGHDLLTGFEAIQFNDRKIDIGEKADPFTDIEGVTQFVIGTSAEETFKIAGQSSDYGWAPTEDGEGIVVWGPTGADLLYEVEKIAFEDKTVTIDNSTPGGSQRVENDPSRTEYLSGTGDDDIFVIAGQSGDYGWGKTDDANTYVVWNTETETHDLLTAFEKIEFEDTTVTLEEF